MSQFERIACIDRLLREQGSVRTAEVAERFEVSARQIKRDIEYLRDRLDAPIVYRRAENAYLYERPFDELRFADEKLLLFYVLARSLAANEHYVPIVSAELLANLESHLARDYRPVSERISYELSLAEPLSMEDFTTVCQAMLLGRRLDLVYVNAKAERSERSVEPERLVNYSGRWYLVAWDLLRGALRTFHLSRVEKLSLSKEFVASPSTPGRDDVSVEAYLASGFGIFKGAATVEAKVRIKGPAAALVARQSWHPKQRVERGIDADGEPYTDITLPVADWTELLGRVLSFGSAAEAIAPPEFRKAWREEIRRMGERAGIS
jgi:predicted DNA-binding transcriptional regulator YafY